MVGAGLYAGPHHQDLMNPHHRIMVIGPSGAGKTTLLKCLGLCETSCKTEAVCFSSKAVDTPGEFFEIPRFYHALITSSTKAALILLVADPTRHVRFPSMFTRALRAPSIGVVTKADLASEELLLKAEGELKSAGVSKVFRVSSVTGHGMEDLKGHIMAHGIFDQQPPEVPTVE
ncbi:MAG: EutP/PduV family microcompartment system protein [Thermanaerothrix sp.]|nr:EutP/PduV family microcompartment system protein [Thermanaerothrix sp.]